MTPRYVSRLLNTDEHTIHMSPEVFPPRVVAGWHVLSNQDNRAIANIYRLTTGKTLRV